MRSAWTSWALGMRSGPVIVALLVLGCGSGGAATLGPLGSTKATAAATAATTAAATAPTTPITHATGPADLVLRVTDGGGLLPMEMRLAEMPAVSIYGDGRVIRVAEAGTAPADPLVPRLVESRLTPEGLSLVLSAAGDAGLPGPDRRLGLKDVYDLWSVTFTLIANGATHVTGAYGLGFPDEAKYAPPDEITVRKSLEQLYGHLRDLQVWLGSGGVGPETTYRPARMRAYVAPVMTWPTEAGTTPAPATARPGQDVRPWPLDAPPELFGTIVDANEGTWRCGVLEADLAGRLGVDTATNDTRWQADDRLFRVVVRPILPDEPGCPGQ